MRDLELVDLFDNGVIEQVYRLKVCIADFEPGVLDFSAADGD